LFCLAVQPALEAVQRARVGVHPLGYFDDTYLQGKPGADGGEGTFQTLCGELESLGLRVARHKCGAYSEDAPAAAAVAASLDMQVLPGGLLAAGTPVGSEAFEEEHATKQGNRACELMDTLEGLPLQHQDQLLLLRGSIQQRMAHLPRVCKWDSIGLAVTLVEVRAVDSAYFIMVSNNVSEAAQRQMLLPTRHGGLGLCNTSAVESRAAYMAAATMGQSVMATGPAEFRPFEGLSGA
jgi:hypothetical protein